MLVGLLEVEIEACLEGLRPLLGKSCCDERERCASRPGAFAKLEAALDISEISPSERFAFDPDELVRYAERYGHPEEWIKKAQELHGKVERLEGELVQARCQHEWGEGISMDTMPPVVSERCARCGLVVTTKD